MRPETRPEGDGRAHFEQIVQQFLARRKELGMSIQIHSSHDERARAEVRGRIGALLETAISYARQRTDGGETLPIEDSRLSEEVKAFYFAFTGRQMTNEELQELFNH